MKKRIKPEMVVTGFWLRNDSDGYLEFLVEHNGEWVRVFGSDGPGPAARDQDQNIDHMIHAGGVQNLIDYGHVAGQVRVAPVRGAPGFVREVAIRGRKVGKSDRRAIERRATKRRTDDKGKARLKR